MKKQRRLMVISFFVVFLFALLLPPVLGSDYPPWDVERIRSYCVWDNDNWNMSNWNTTGAWDIDPGYWNAGQPANVAVIDSGIYYAVYNNTPQVHPNLGANVKGMYGFVYNPANPTNPDVYTDPVSWSGQPNPYIIDNSGHGTWVAGVIAAAITGNGIIGPAPEIGIYSMKLNSLGNFNASAEEAAKAIRYAVDDCAPPAKVISISQGWDNDFPDLRSACDYAYSHGALLFAAAGNKNTTELGYPASYPNVIAVGSTDHNDARASFPLPPPDIASNYGPKLEFMAPGVDINTTDWGGGYISLCGTSLSTPLVAATAALVFGSKMDPNFGPVNSSWTNDEVRLKLILNGKLDLGPPGRDNDTGWGLTNAWLPNQRPVGDINLDGKTDIKDIALAQKAYGSVPGSPTWDPRADVNIDKTVGIKDIAIIAKHFGESDP